MLINPPITNLKTVIGNFMKRQSYLLKIDNPCGQDWNSMTQNDIGKFCSNCSKTVVDFTNLTDAEIIQLIEQSSGKLCGRLTKQQLNRSIETGQPKNNSRFYKLLAGLMLVGTTESAFAIEKQASQIEIVSPTQSAELSKETVNAEANLLPDSLKNVVQGIIYDAETKDPLPFANVWLKNTRIGAVTDFDGKFKFVIPDSLVQINMALIISYVGYESLEILIDKEYLPITQELVIKPGQFYNIELLAGTIGLVTVIKTKKWWQFWK